MNEKQYAEIIERLTFIKDQQMAKTTQEMLFVTLEQLADHLGSISKLLEYIKTNTEFHKSETLIS